MKIPWDLIVAIIKFILDLIGKGKSKQAAISQAALKFNLSESVVANIFDEHSKK